MCSTFINLFRRHRLDIYAALTLVLLCVSAGAWELRNWRGPAFTLTNELYVPAAMFALGKGMVNPPLQEVPGLREFLYSQGEGSFNPGALPQQFSSTELDTYQRYHRYLIFAMGLVWRILGVSWEAAKVLAIGLYVTAMMLIYIIFRQNLPRAVALVGALIVANTPATMHLIFNIRDYGKSPFIIATIGILLFLILNARDKRHYLVAAGLAGLVAGIGVGFRRDLLVCIPPCLMVLALCGVVRGIRIRAAGTALYIITFCLASAPILASFADRGAAIYHDSIMGMATQLDDGLGMTRASYERVPVKHDLYVTGLANTHARRVAGVGSEAYDNVSAHHDPDERPLFFWMNVFTFPADFILRAYGAVLRVCQGVTPFWTAWASHLALLGPIYVLTVIASSMRFGLGSALLLVLLLLYFGGITSVQFEARHTAHLDFISVGCCLLFWTGAWQIFRRRTVTLPRGELRQRILLPIGLLAMMLLTWALALPWQIYNVHAIERQLRVAQKIEIPVARVDVEDTAYFIPAHSLPVALPDPKNVQNYFRPLYFGLELESFPVGAPVEILCQTRRGVQDFTSWHKTCPVEQVDARYFYFVNLPEFMSPDYWVALTGIGLPKLHASHFKSLVAVVLPEPIATNPNFFLPEDANRVATWQGLSYWPPWQQDPPKYRMSEMRAKLDSVHQLMQAGEFDAANATINEILPTGLARVELYCARARIAAATGQLDAANEGLRQALIEMPGDVRLLWELEAINQSPTPR